MQTLSLQRTRSAVEILGDGGYKTGYCPDLIQDCGEGKHSVFWNPPYFSPEEYKIGEARVDSLIASLARTAELQGYLEELKLGHTVIVNARVSPEAGCRGRRRPRKPSAFHGRLPTRAYPPTSSTVAWGIDVESYAGGTAGREFDATATNETFETSGRADFRQALRMLVGPPRHPSGRYCAP
jgi:hypothetical protein